MVRLQASEAPDFAIPQGHGTILRLSDYRNQKHVLLILNRGFT